MAVFLILAALMIAIALAFLLVPLLRAPRAAGAGHARRKLALLDASRRDGLLNDAEYAAKRAQLAQDMLESIDAAHAPRAGFGLAIALALLVPALAIVLYRVVGTPMALAPGALDAAEAPADHQRDMAQAIANLAAKLAEHPDDAQGWALLGRAYEATQQFDKARDALKHAYDLAHDDPDIAVAYAEALALSQPTRRIDGEARRILDEALKAAPDNQRGLWLLGISEFQANRYDAAIAAWNRLLANLPAESDIRASVQQQIARATAARDGKPLPGDDDAAQQAPAASDAAATAPAAAAPATGDGPHLEIVVALDPKLRDKLAPDDVLFVYAKAVSGPPMPLAIQRLPAKSFPLRVTLTDGMGMLPNMKLSQFPQVVIGARVSHSGNAMPQSGDLQVLSAPVAVDSKDPIPLTIDSVIP